MTALEIAREAAEEYYGARRDGFTEDLEARFVAVIERALRQCPVPGGLSEEELAELAAVDSDARRDVLAGALAAYRRDNEHLRRSLQEIVTSGPEGEACKRAEREKQTVGGPRLFAVAISARRGDLGFSCAILMLATNRDEATGQAWRWARRAYPAGEGYGSLNVCVSLSDAVTHPDSEPDLVTD